MVSLKWIDRGNSGYDGTTVQRLVNRSWIAKAGQKTGKGFRVYDEGRTEEKIMKIAMDSFAENRTLRGQSGLKHHPIHG